jgi:hypothetical protein
MIALDIAPEETKRQARQAEEMQQRYRNVFGSEEGRRVLGDILTLGHFGETLDPNDPVAVASYNFALTIARMAGALDPLYTGLGIFGKT